MTLSIKDTEHNSIECYHAEYRYAECRVPFIVTLNVIIMLSVVMMNVVMLRVVMPPIAVV
jgi:hypothetical protein